MNVSRYIDTVELKFDVEFVTPCFLGGADGNAEIRTAPFKAGIRYWWRILYGAKYAAVEKLIETESNIFGSTEKKSLLDVIVLTSPHKDSFTEKTGFPKGRRIDVEHQGRSMKVNILDYLAYGKYEYVRGLGNVYNTTYLKAGTKITVRIIIKNNEHISEIKDAVKMFFMWGGVGSKSRNGFGSMLAGVHTFPFSMNAAVSNEPKDFPVISNLFRFFITKKTFANWEQALSEIGCIYKDARTAVENKHQYYKRGFVARPIEVKGEKIPDNIRNGRNPKPFYMGIMKVGDKYRGYILSIPVCFYEKEKQTEYLRVIDEINKDFSLEMKDDTSNFLKSFTGVAK